MGHLHSNISADAFPPLLTNHYVVGFSMLEYLKAKFTYAVHSLTESSMAQQDTPHIAERRGKADLTMHDIPATWTVDTKGV